MKHYAFELEARKRFEIVTVHTGQHYDDNMSQIFFDELSISAPQYMLNIGSKSQGAQTGEMMSRIEEIAEDENPDWMIVYGDTNSTLAGALVASKLHIPLAHIEAGLRSYNKLMPEEVNRLLTDHVSDLLLVPSETSQSNLRKEGITKNVYVVGDILKDLIISIKEKINNNSNHIDYVYATIHRPYNTDNADRLNYVLSSLNKLQYPVVLSTHPRTKNAMSRFDLNNSRYSNIQFIDPVGYLENIENIKNSKCLITDSGGMQKEAYWLNKKCITIRTETEWIETLKGEANHLVFEDLENINELVNKKSIWNPELYGQGNTGELISKLLDK